MLHPLLIDAVMTTRNAACLAEFALSPLFTRQWSSIYEALQDSRPDRKKLMVLGVAELMYDITIESKIDKNNEHRVRVN